ncbi:hypothetical protein HOLleu_26640 [Holothuria leucospilota]|uniref:Uncharacterized protein n=1 Tax=Holothuria leucospilota TaxID=206669 RepID=A0A9Q1BPL9_HOLLE|nr:hypothetical protein HOLleu_26640 [Holothuria leucospilota]
MLLLPEPSERRFPDVRRRRLMQMLLRCLTSGGQRGSGFQGTMRTRGGGGPATARAGGHGGQARGTGGYARGRIRGGMGQSRGRTGRGRVLAGGRTGRGGQASRRTRGGVQPRVRARGGRR